MEAIDIINAAVVLIGVPTIGAVLISFGRKFEALDQVQKTINERIQPDLKDVRERFFAFEGKASNLFKSASPVALTETGKQILIDSGLKEHLDTDTEMFMTFCKEHGSLTNPYDVQNTVFSMFDNYTFYPELNDKLKTYAYEKGISMSILKRIAAIYFRDICLTKLGMDPADIDKHDPELVPVAAG